MSNAERELMIAIADALSSLLHHQIVGGNGSQLLEHRRVLSLRMNDVRSVKRP